VFFDPPEKTGDENMVYTYGMTTYSYACDACASTLSFATDVHPEPQSWKCPCGELMSKVA